MEMQQQGLSIEGKRGTRGRKDIEGQESVIKLDGVRKQIDYLVGLHNAARDAATLYAEAIKVHAEKAGLLASVVRKYCAARAGEKFDEEKTKVGQLALIFDIED